ncbi:MAG: THUMP domain-containing protein [archaeon]
MKKKSAPKPELKPSTILVRFGEIALKSPRVRRKFASRLVGNMRRMLPGHPRIKKEWSRVFVEAGDPEVLSALTKIFGIVSVSPAYVCAPTMPEIQKLALKLAKEHIKKTDSFAIRARRAGTHKFTSQDIGIKIGDAVRKASGAKVNLGKPTKELFIEARQDHAYVFIESIKAPGGLPYGVEGKVLGLYEGSAEFKLATYLLAKRGCEIELLGNAPADFMKEWLGGVKVHSKMPNDDRLKAVYTADTIKDIKKFAAFDKKYELEVFRPLLGLNESAIKKALGILH